MLLVVLLAVMLSSCKEQPADPAPPTTVATTTTKTTTTTKPPVRFENLLTGEAELKTKRNRPVAFMIGNSGYYGPLQQKNIEKADLFVEAETEAGIPRIMAVFGSIENVPDEIGPVRSARTHFVKIAKSLDAIYCHIGGSPIGLKTIRQNGITDMNGMGGNFAKPNQQLWDANRASEHTKVFIRKNLVETMKNRGTLDTTLLDSPYRFGDKKGEKRCKTVELNISASKKVAFTYVYKSGVYKKHRTDLSSDIHKSIDGKAITAKNVIIMYDERYWEDKTHVSFQMKAGEGLLLVNGTARSIRWSRTDDRLSFTEQDGTPLTVAQGKTYICLTDKNLAGKTEIQ